MVFGHFGSREVVETLKNHVGFWSVWSKVLKSDILDPLAGLAKTYGQEGHLEVVQEV